MSEDKKPEPLSVFNHLAVDDTMRFVSPYGLGSTDFNPLNYVHMCLSPLLAEYVPSDVRDMFDRAKATMSYGVYHYPLFTAGMEALYRLMEAALYYRARQHGCAIPEKKAMFYALLKYCEDNNLIAEPELTRWDACRRMRNSASHQKSTSLFFPNTAVHSLQITKELVEALFVYGPPNLVDFYKRQEQYRREDAEFRAYLKEQDGTKEESVV